MNYSEFNRRFLERKDAMKVVNSTQNVRCRKHVGNSNFALAYKYNRE